MHVGEPTASARACTSSLTDTSARLSALVPAQPWCAEKHEEHCLWCKCRGCAGCSHVATSPTAHSPAAKIHAPSASAKASSARTARPAARLQLRLPGLGSPSRDAAAKPSLLGQGLPIFFTRGREMRVLSRPPPPGATADTIARLMEIPSHSSPLELRGINWFGFEGAGAVADGLCAVLAHRTHTHETRLHAAAMCRA